MMTISFVYCVVLLWVGLVLEGIIHHLLQLYNLQTCTTISGFSSPHLPPDEY
jgi:hypothetical protein